MKATDLGLVLKGIAPVVREFVASSVETFAKRLEALEARPVINGKDGQDATPPDIEALAHRAAALIPSPKDGKDWTLPDLEVLARRAADLIPKPKDGKDSIPPDLDVLAQRAAALVPRPKDGKDADTEALKQWMDAEVDRRVSVARDGFAALVKAEIEHSMAAIPKPKDGESVTVADVTPVIASEVGKAMAAIQRPKDGQPGKDVDPEFVRAEVLKAVAAIPPAKDGLAGKNVDPVVMQASIDQAVAKAVAAIPPAKNGQDGTSVTLSDVEATIWMQVQKAVAALPAAKDGHSVTIADVAPLIGAEVARAVSVIPIPKDGRSVTVEDVTPLIAAEVTKAVATIPTPKEARSITSGFLDRSGNLMLAFSDGTTTNVGLVIGKDADPAELKRLVLEEVAKIPKPLNGKDGDPGRDGFSPDDLDLEWVPETRSMHVRLLRDGVVVKDVGKPLYGVTIWKGTYSAGKSYVYGDIVTWNGAAWLAKDSTTDKPGDGKTAWQLIVMRGEKGERGEGKAGRDGRDLTNLGPDGSKWGK